MFYNLIFKIFYSFAGASFLFTILIFTNSGCLTKSKSTIPSEDSTSVYHQIYTKDIISDISLSTKVNRVTGEPLDAETIFPIKDKAKLYAAVYLKNRVPEINKDLMIHIDWIDPGGKSFYKKRIDIQQNDSTSALLSSISISPEKRQTGNYTLRVYYFRKLIAEKKFQLTETLQNPPDFDYSKITDQIKGEINFYKGISKKTGEPIGKSKIFTINNKAKVLAAARIINTDISLNQQLLFTADWIAPNDSSFYKKSFKYSPTDSLFTISSSISILPEKRKPGIYRHRIYLFEKLIAEEEFVLVNPIEEKKNIIAKVKKENISADIIFCRKVSKETGKPVGIDSVFTIRDKANLKAIVNFENLDTSRIKHLEIYLDWAGPGEKSFYKKKVILSTDNPAFSFSNSISISPQKRKPGDYILRVLLFKELVVEKKFKLIPEAK